MNVKSVKYARDTHFVVTYLEAMSVIAMRGSKVKF